MGEKCRLNGDPAERPYRLHVAAADDPVHSQAAEPGLPQAERQEVLDRIVAQVAELGELVTSVTALARGDDSASEDIAQGQEPEAGAPALSGEPASPPVEGEEPREVRRRRGREERPRATNAAEQAWGQPAGTMKFAPPPGPTVVAQTTSREESPPADPGESAEEPEQPPEDPKPDSF